MKMAASGRMNRLHEAIDRNSPRFSPYPMSPAYVTGASGGHDPRLFDQYQCYQPSADISKDQLASIYAAQADAREMEALTPQSTHEKKGKVNSPGMAQGRYSGHHNPTPKSNNFRHSQVVPPTDEPGGAPGIVVSSEQVGPGEGQVQDHNLHEQYFGIPSSTNASREDLHQQGGVVGLGLSERPISGVYETTPGLAR